MTKQSPCGACGYGGACAVARFISSASAPFSARKRSRSEVFSVRSSSLCRVRMSSSSVWVASSSCRCCVRSATYLDRLVLCLEQRAEVGELGVLRARHVARLFVLALVPVEGIGRLGGALGLRRMAAPQLDILHA